jgi:tRNA-specific 2-thiouridylase
MKLFDNDDIGESCGRSCCSLSDVQDAARVSARLEIPHYTANFTDEFRVQVMDRFAASYMKGETPNPCIDCNRYMKYDRLYRRMEELGFDYIATGHYARTAWDEKSGRYLLLKGVDESKDQSYVLYALTQKQLAHTDFPLGKLTKKEVREIAEDSGFVNARKKDSQDICFVPDGDYAHFIEEYTGKTFPPGNFVDKDGGVLGRHEGIVRYTIGQRKGLGMAFGRPMFVKEIRPISNEVVLSEEEGLFSAEVTARNINLISVPVIEKPMRVQAKIRYSQRAASATLMQTAGDEIRVVFDEPQRAATKGQALVMYDGDIVVGGGTIC